MKQSNDLEIELKEFKEKWAATQCELIDVEEQLKESEEERQKTLKYLTQCLQNLDDNREKISALESMLEENQQSGMNISTTKKVGLIKLAIHTFIYELFVTNCLVSNED